jgi:hypothetical protein
VSHRPEVRELVAGTQPLSLINLVALDQPRSQASVKMAPPAFAYYGKGNNVKRCIAGSRHSQRTLILGEGPFILCYMGSWGGHASKREEPRRRALWGYTSCVWVHFTPLFACGSHMRWWCCIYTFLVVDSCPESNFPAVDRSLHIAFHSLPCMSFCLPS